MNRLLGSCLGLISGRSWENLKAAVEVPFSHRSTTSYVNDIQAFTKSYLAQLSKQNAAFHEQGLLHPVRDLKLLPFLFIAKIIYGPLSDKAQKDLLALIPQRENVFKHVIAGGITRFQMGAPSPAPCCPRARGVQGSVGGVE